SNAIIFFPISGCVGISVPSNETNAIRALSNVPSAMTATPPGASSIKPLLVSTPVDAPSACRRLHFEAVGQLLTVDYDIAVVIFDMNVTAARYKMALTSAPNTPFHPLLSREGASSTRPTWGSDS